MTTKDIEVEEQAQTPPPVVLPDPLVGDMWCVLTLQPNINQQIVNDLMRDIASNLQTVTHLVNNVQFKANVAGVILTYSTAILPAMTGDLEPVPLEGL